MIIDQISSEDDAVNILTCTPCFTPIRKLESARRASTRDPTDDAPTRIATRSHRKVVASSPTGRPGQHPAVKMWRGSILDEASSTLYPCRRFLSHRHCQRVFDLYLAGIYRGSALAVPAHSSVFTLLLQCICHCLQPLFLGHFPLHACAVSQPRFVDLPGEHHSPAGAMRRLSTLGALHGEVDEESDGEVRDWYAMLSPTLWLGPAASPHVGPRTSAHVGPRTSAHEGPRASAQGMPHPALTPHGQTAQVEGYDEDYFKVESTTVWELRGAYHRWTAFW